MTLGWIGLCRSSPCCLPALQSCYALLNQHILCRLMNDRCFIHEGKIVYILWSTFQVLWRELSTEADGLKGMKIDWIHYYSRSCLQMKRWFWQSVDVWAYDLSRPVPQQVMPSSVSWNTSITVHSSHFGQESWLVLWQRELQLQDQQIFHLWNSMVKKKKNGKDIKHIFTRDEMVTCCQSYENIVVKVEVQHQKK